MDGTTTPEVPSGADKGQRATSEGPKLLTREAAVAWLQEGDRKPEEDRRVIINKKTGDVFIVEESVSTTKEGGKTPRRHEALVDSMVELGMIGDKADAVGAYGRVFHGELDWGGEAHEFTGATIDEFEDALDKGRIQFIPQDIGLEPQQAK